MTKQPVPDVGGADVTREARRKLSNGSSPSDEGFDVLFAKRGSLYRKTALVRAVQMAGDFQVHTREGLMQGYAGDYLCKGADGEYWPIKQEIFLKTYVLETA